MGLLQSCKQTLFTGRQDNNKKYAFYQLTWVIAKNRLKFLYSLFHFTDLKKNNFLSHQEQNLANMSSMQLCL